MARKRSKGYTPHVVGGGLSSLGERDWAAKNQDSFWADQKDKADRARKWSGQPRPGQK